VKTRQLGSLVVSVVGLGTNNFGTDLDEIAALLAPGQMDAL
jgi:hypothetical protein